jgi:penicillin-binding protein 1C
VPSVELLNDVGVRAFTAFLVSLGFESIGEESENGYSKAGLGLALGDAPVSLLELVQGFSIFPRGGEYLNLSYVPGPGSGERVIAPSTAALIIDILSDPFERTMGFGMTDPFQVDFDVAVKTGTSSMNQNIWAVAATSHYTIGVWLGNFSGETVVGRTGSSIPARIALEVLAQLAARDPRQTDGSDTLGDPGVLGDESRLPVAICTVSGMAAGPYCPSTRKEYLLAEEKGKICTFHNDPSGGAAYPQTFSPWIDYYGKAGKISGSAGMEFSIIYPAEGAVFYIDRSLPLDMQAVKIEALHPAGDEVELSVNGRSYGTGDGRETYASWLVPLVPGTWHIDVRGSTGSISSRIEVN